ncbi:MAG: hypothetical protein FWD84_01350 [Oscillospiraceae bacterium]|nr:hypothetical protein [Oscillospiraceae bacterium]
MIRFDGKSEVEKGHVLYELMPLNNSITFFQGAIFQGDRLSEAIKLKNDHSFDLVKLEEEFFIFALDRAVYYLKMIKDSPELVDILNQIDIEIGSSAIKDTRDMRTHVDSYIYKDKKKKGGRKQEKFYITPIDAPASFKIKPSIDATSSIMVGDWYLIGGRVDFYKTISLLKKLFPAIKAICQIKKMELLNAHRTK